MTNTLLSNLNESQQQSVTTTEGYIRVIAGAGSGKTRAITHRYAYLVNHLGISQRNILCVTFTNKAASEMKNRLQSMLGDLGHSFICTFHAFCAQLIREDSGAIHFPKHFTILDEEDRRALIVQALDDLGIDRKALSVKAAMEVVGLSKRSLSYLPYLLDSSAEQLSQAIESATHPAQKLFRYYCHLQRKVFGLDFQDLINVALHILQTSDRIRMRWQEQMQYIMVDEFQDVNDKQFELCKILSQHHGNLFVVGDPDQTIYSFRGASPDHILRFDEKFPNVRTILMNQNYRSGSRILSAANALIDKNTDRIKKDLVSCGSVANASSVYYHAKTRVKEARWVSEKVKDLIQSGVQHSDIAVLYRAHHISRPFEEAFVQNQIPYTIHSGIEFYHRAEVKTTLAYLHMTLSADDLAFVRTINMPPRRFGQKRMETLKALAQQSGQSLYQTLVANAHLPIFEKCAAASYISLVEKYRFLAPTLPVSDLLQGLLEESGYEEYLRNTGEEERLDHLAELKQSIAQFEKDAGQETSLQDYLTSVSLYTNADRQQAASAVQFMTVHTAKGMEFDHVFVVGFNEGVLPSKNARDRKDLEEERRVAYVAYTRAKRSLFLSDSEEPTETSSMLSYPSRFLFNTESHNLDYVVQLPKLFQKSALAYIEKWEQDHFKPTTPPPNVLVSPQLSAGQRVFHPIHLQGVVIEDKPDERCLVIRFDQYKTNRTLGYAACQYLSPITQTEKEASAEVQPLPPPKPEPIAAQNVLLKEKDVQPDPKSEPTPEPAPKAPAVIPPPPKPEKSKQPEPKPVPPPAPVPKQKPVPFDRLPPQKLPLFPGFVGFVVILLLAAQSDSPWGSLLGALSLLYMPAAHLANIIRMSNYEQAKIAHEKEQQRLLGHSTPTIIATHPHYVAVQEPEKILTIDQVQIAFDRISHGVLITEKHRTNDKANAYLVGRALGGHGAGTYMALSTQNQTIVNIKGVDIYLKRSANTSSIQSAATGIKPQPDFSLQMESDEAHCLYNVILEIVRTQKR